MGDGANDLPMLLAAGTGVALHAKPRVQAQCDIRVNHGDLTALLYCRAMPARSFRMIVRQSVPSDAPAMAEVLNAIIAIGGTTAHEHPKTADDVCADYVNGPEVLASVVAEDQGRVIGWQSVGMWEGDPHIGTFVQPGCRPAASARRCLPPPARSCGPAARLHHRPYPGRQRAGAGLLRPHRLSRHRGDPGFALSDGRRVGRIHRRFDL